MTEVGCQDIAGIGGMRRWTDLDVLHAVIDIQCAGIEWARRGAEVLLRFERCSQR